MKRIEFLEKLNKNPNISIKMEGKDIDEISMNNVTYKIKEDRLYLRNTINLNFIVINFNVIREINFIENTQEIIIYLEDEYDTKIKISAINDN